MRLIPLVLMAAMLAPCAARAQTTKPANPVNSKSMSAVDAAIRALGREYATGQSAISKGKIRKECDYFHENPSPDLTPDAVLSALERGARDNSAQACYVKWQLLSGIDGDIPDGLVRRATAIYTNFGALAPQPGMKQDSRSELELRRRNCQESGVAELNKYIADEQEKVNRANEPILAFRDELFSRLPACYETIAAGFEDAHNRLKSGAETKSIVEKASEATQSWSSKGTAQQLKTLSEALRTLSKERGTQYYDSANWSESTRKVTFYKKSPTLDKKALEDLAQQLAEQAQNPTPGGLKFKDPEKDRKP